MKIEQFSSLDVIGPPEYSSQQLFKASLPGYSGSDRGGEETCRARRGSNKERNEVYILDQEYSCLYDDKVWE
jgi:hypothetical protein